MTSDFKDHNDFDKYAWENGKWAYDNGWCYQGERFGAAYIREEFGKAETGELDYLLMLREGDVLHRTLIIHGIGAQLTEIWSGEIEARDDFDRMMKIVSGYIEQSVRPASHGDETPPT
jgi:hypothetical protein